MTWAEDRRADKLAAAQIRIQEADAAAKRRRDDRAADAKTRRADRDARSARLTKLRIATTTWLSEHRVRLTIAMLAAASAIMAIPAMASYGRAVYGDATGIVLPVLSELGAWAFTFAVHDARTKRKDAPVWALLVGVWLFALGGAGMNVAHGIGQGWGDAAVMGFAAIAGIVAHQLAVASPRRSAAERAAARLNRAARRKAERVRRAAIAEATAAIDPAGQVSLVFPAGSFRLDSRGRLEPILDPDPFGAEERAIEAARRVLGGGPALDSRPDPSVDRSTLDDSIGTSPIGVLDPPGDQHESNPGEASIERRKSTLRRPKSTVRKSTRRGRSIEELREAFKAELARPGSAMNPTSAESIRKTLQVAPDKARRLRDDHLRKGG